MIMFMVATNGIAQDVKANIRAAYDALNRRDYAAFTKLCAPDFTEYAAGSEPVKSPEAAIETYKVYFNAFPDLRFTIDEITKGDDARYFVKVNITGTNDQPFWMLPATHKNVNVNDLDIIEVNSKGLAVSHWSANPYALLRAIGYGSLENPATAVIMEVYNKFGSGDIAGVLEMTDDDAVFNVHDPDLYDDAMMFKGKTEIARFFADLGNKIQYTKFQPWRFVADGDDVFALVSAEYKHPVSGKMIATNYTHHFKVTNGRISYFKGLTELQKTYDKKLAEANIRALFEVMDSGKSERLKDYCNSDFHISNPLLPVPSPIQAFEGILMTQKTAFPDMKHEVVELTTDGHYVTTRGIFSGTNTGPMMSNPPSGNKVVIPFIVLDELDTMGKIKNRYVQFDLKSFEAQLMASK